MNPLRRALLPALLATLCLPTTGLVISARLAAATPSRSISRTIRSLTGAQSPALAAPISESRLWSYDKRRAAKAVRRHPAVPHKASSLNVYEATLSGKVPSSLRGVRGRVYVPNSRDGTVDVIDPRTYKIINHFAVGYIPHHIAPAWDLSQLYVDNEGSSSLTVIDPRAGKPTRTIPVSYPYNLYFTPDGKKAIVVVERLSRLDFRDTHRWNLIKSVFIPFPGVDHLDFSADGRYFLASSEWSGMVVKVDTGAMKVIGWINVGGLPVDVRLAPDGSVFYVANQGRGGVSIVDPNAMKVAAFLRTGTGAHGLVVSRDTKYLYVSNRWAGTISVISFAKRQVVKTWKIGGTPDMLSLSPKGRRLWVSGRYSHEVKVIDTRTGIVVRTIPVGFGPHGLCYFPNAGRFSLGHNGVYR